MGKAELYPYASLADACTEVAKRLCHSVRVANASDAESWSVALSGGRSARALMEKWAQLIREEKLNLEKVHFFWGDERCVPPGDPESNYIIAQEAFLTPLQIPLERVHRILGEAPPPFAAQQAEAELMRISPVSSDGIPIIDVVLLGMGEDGHVASLFPNTDPAIANGPAAFVPVIGPKPPPQRISVTYPILQHAKEIWVVASGAGKIEALQRSLASGDTPLGRCIRSRERTAIFTDFILP